MHRLFEIVERINLRGEQRGDERLVLVAIHWRVEVIAPRSLVVARLPVELREVEGVGGEDRRDGVVKIQTVAPEELIDRLEERMRRERPRGDDHEIVAVRIDRCYLVTIDCDISATLDRPSHRCCKAIAIDGKRIACGNTRLRAAADDQRSEDLHLTLEEADGVDDR